jgi:hypothetical protein
MEDVAWQPPKLSFAVERHGGMVMGSTRADVQHWEVDLEKRTTSLAKAGRRQVSFPCRPQGVKLMLYKVTVNWHSDRASGRWTTLVRADDEGQAQDRAEEQFAAASEEDVIGVPRFGDHEVVETDGDESEDQTEYYDEEIPSE